MCIYLGKTFEYIEHGNEKNGTKEKGRIKKANQKPRSFLILRNKDILFMCIYLGKTIGYIKHGNEKRRKK